MTPSSPTPQLPKWIFFLTDAALLFTAWYIANRSPGPLSAAAIFGVVACVIVGAILGTMPLVIHYEREKNEALDDRQRALEALASTVATSAEQISIAASGQHTIAELAQKNLQLAEQLPGKFQDKIDEFESLLTTAQTDERNELKQELARVRAAESERLEAIAAKIEQAARELAKLEAAAHKHLTAAQATLAMAPEALTAATNAALAQIEAKVSATFGSRPPMTVAAAAQEPVRTVPPPMELTAPPFGGHLISSAPIPAPEATPAAPAQAAPTEATAPLPPTTPSDAPAPVSAASEIPAAAVTADAEAPKPVRKRAPRKPKPEPTADAPFALEATATAAPPALANSPAPEIAPEATPAKKSAPAAEFDQTASAEAPSREGIEIGENVISSDRATRLLVTAYIGIGNRLFIRGEGPGLSWDKGVPLQFVSIGKWRWETNDAATAVKFKLFKNDEIECGSLGSQSLAPEHQLEVTATF